MVAFATVTGGAVALTGGNFWVGAATGLVVSVCNHLAHQMSDDSDPPKKGEMKSSDSYDYSNEHIPGKTADDMEYISNGNGGNMATRAWDIFKRDWSMASTGDKVQFGLAITPFRIIKLGEFGVEANTLHRVIKPSILKATSKEFVKVVGKNPDILIKGENIFLTGSKSSPYFGKSFNTGLKALDYFK